MISKVKVVRDQTQWHPWFAWRPVRVSAGDSRMFVWVWWHMIERKFVGHYDGFDVTYRLKKDTA